MEVWYSPSHSSASKSSSSSSSKRKLEFNNGTFGISDMNNLSENGGFHVEDTSSDASSYCSSSNLSWESAESSFKRLRIHGNFSNTSSLSDCVIVEEPQKS